MSHYDEFYQNSADLWESNGSERQQQDMPTVDYDSIYTDYENYKSIVGLKQKNGKPEGARYCFLDCISHVVDRNDEKANFLGEAIDKLVISIDNNNSINSITKYIQAINNCILTYNNNEVIINDLINLRMQALSTGKYKKNGYKKKIDLQLLLDALARHYIKFVFLGPLDKDSGYLHLAHMLANLIMIKYQINKYKL